MKGRPLPLYALALGTLLVHFFFASRQGFFSDETYFIDCARHLSFGYFDITPLVPFLLRISHVLFGDTLFGVRLFPALGHAGTVLLAGLVAAELGGAGFAQVLAALSVALAPGYLILGGIFLTPSLEPFFWTLTAYFLIRLINAGSELRSDLPTFWLAAGAAVGMGFLNKPSMLLYAASLEIGLAITSSKRILRDPWMVGGALLAFALMLPNLVWQFTHDWNTLVFLTTLRRSALFKNAGGLQLLLAPLVALHPLAGVLWVGGLVSLFAAPRLRPYRAWGWAFLFSFAFLLLTGGKAYYLAGIYPVLIAAGARSLESGIREMLSSAGARKAEIGALGIYLIAGLLLVPAALPVFSLERTQKYLEGPLEPVARSIQAIEVRWDMKGEERQRLLTALGQAYARLSVDERYRTVILTSHYFQASWIDVLGPAYGLPGAVSGNNSYALWGPGARAGDSTLAIGFQSDYLTKLFREVSPVPESTEIMLCRHPIRPLTEIWPELRSAPF